ncbi:hypothetical protein CFC21_017583 [Triticum aestivum]|uniref:HTH myb-type domain-containing protein n=4 Tax=Triticum TaxID=4564 RepID=A0A9R1R2W6_TRITD|nr:hypothetical protein CFC21_017583 [Triticum aestivum]VAH26287.1 unnamed protein product [Triticum turgidum subsp. durum]
MCSMQAEHCQYMTEPEQMYHQQQQQFHDHRQHMSSRPSLSPEKKFFMKGQGGAGGGGDSGLILSTDAKPRLKWTPELHERFADAVKKLGGPDKATPKAIMRVMGIPGLTLYHLKSHLQKFRLSKNLQAQANAVNAKNVYGFGTATDKACEGHGSSGDHLNRETNTSRSMHINDALQMQIEVQRRLHEQIEVQRHLQLRIEAQGKYLHSVLEKAQEALGKQHVVAGLEAAEPTQRLPELASSVRRGLLQNDGSADDSCLTASEDILSMGLSASATRRGCGAPFETSASASREEDEECYLFLGKPEGRREVRRDGCNGGAAFGKAAELDLSIGVVAASSRRRPDGGDRLDLNGSGWN